MTVRIRPAFNGPVAGRWDSVDEVFTWPVLDRVEADAAEGERALAWLVLQSDRPGYGFAEASWRKYGERFPRRVRRAGFLHVPIPSGRVS